MNEIKGKRSCPTAVRIKYYPKAFIHMTFAHMFEQVVGLRPGSDRDYHSRGKKRRS